MDHTAAARLAGVGHAHRRLSEGVLAAARARLPRPRALAGEQLRHQRGEDDLQRPGRRRAGAVLHGHRADRDPRLSAGVVDGAGREEGAGCSRSAVRRVAAGCADCWLNAECRMQNAGVSEFWILNSEF